MFYLACDKERMTLHRFSKLFHVFCKITLNCLKVIHTCYKKINLHSLLINSLALLHYSAVRLDWLITFHVPIRVSQTRLFSVGVPTGLLEEYEIRIPEDDLNRLLTPNVFFARSVVKR